jgi:hypothetical protein
VTDDPHQGVGDAGRDRHRPGARRPRRPSVASPGASRASRARARPSESAPTRCARQFEAVAQRLEVEAVDERFDLELADRDTTRRPSITETSSSGNLGDRRLVGDEVDAARRGPERRDRRGQGLAGCRR